MFHSKLLYAGLLVMIATPLGAQTIHLPAGSPMPMNVPAGVGVVIGGVTMQAGVLQMQGISSAAQEAARAAAASAGAPPNFQYLAPPLDGLNVNVLNGGVMLPADVGTPALIQSGSSLMIGSTPPAVGGGSAKAATDTDGNGPSDSKSGDKHRHTNQSDPTANAGPIRPPGSGGSGESGYVAPSPTSGEPLPPDQPQSPVVKPPIPTPEGGPKPTGPRPSPLPNPTGKPASVVATPSEIRSRDPVAERIDQGMERDVGVVPPILHQIDNVGVSVPSCMRASREGLECD